MLLLPAAEGHTFNRQWFRCEMRKCVYSTFVTLTDAATEYLPVSGSFSLELIRADLEEAKPKR